MDWLSDTTAQIPAQWIPVIAVLVAALIGVVGYVVQKFIDRRFELKKLREEAYSNYLQAMYEGITSGDKEKKDKHSQEYFRLFAVASDEVLDTTGELWVYLRDTSSPQPKKPRSQEEVDKLFIAMFKAMRKDCFQPTKLKDTRIAEIFPLEV
jgi:hypothetical protein